MHTSAVTTPTQEEEKIAKKAKKKAAKKRKVKSDDERAVYNANYKKAGELYGAGGITLRAAAAEAAACCGGEPISPTSVSKSASGVPLKCPGRQQRYPADAELQLVEVILELRSMKVITNRTTVMCIAVRMLADTPAAADYIDEDTGNVRLPGWWYDGFVKRHSNELKKVKGKATEGSRSQWTKGKYLKQHFDILQGLALDNGIAKENPNFDLGSKEARTNPFCLANQPIIMLPSETHRILSLDETHTTMETTDSMSGQDVLCGVDEDPDCVEYIVNKSSNAATLVGGSDASGNALPSFSIFKGDSFKAEWIESMPNSEKAGKDRKPLEARATVNKSGGMTNEMGVSYMKEVILPYCWDARADNRYILTLDGHSSHLTPEFVRLCKDNYIDLVLRIPHTTHWTQPEDLLNFGVFKRILSKLISELQAKMIIKSSFQKNGNVEHQVGFKDWNVLVPDAWTRAFTPKNNRSAWEMAGIVPFTRKPLQAVYRQEYDAAQHEKRRLNKAYVKVPFEKRDAEYLMCAAETRKLPKLDEVTDRTTIRSGDFALNGSLSRGEALAVLEKKGNAKKEEEARLAGGRADRAAKKESKASEGAEVWAKLIVGERNLKIGTECDVCDSKCVCRLTGQDLERLAIFKNVKVPAQTPVSVLLATLEEKFGDEINQCVIKVKDAQARAVGGPRPTPRDEPL